MWNLALYFRHLYFNQVSYGRIWRNNVRILKAKIVSERTELQIIHESGSNIPLTQMED